MRIRLLTARDHRRAAMLGLVVAGLVLAGCSDDKPSRPVPGVGLQAGQPAPAFLLRDVNPDSPTHDQNLSPSVFNERISVWFFGSGG